jgi:transposase
MTGHSFRSQVELLPVTDSGRRRRWTEPEKLRIVEESLAGPRLVSTTARRHEISRALTRWRKDYRLGLLGGMPAFTSVSAVPDREPMPELRPDDASRSEGIEIRLVNGWCLIVPVTLEPTALARLVQVLDPS